MRKNKYNYVKSKFNEEFKSAVTFSLQATQILEIKG